MSLAIRDLDGFVFGHAPHPVECGNGLVIGGGTVVPEINFTLPEIEICDATWPEVVRQYRDIIATVVARAVELEVPGLLVEFETLPPMTSRPEWGAEITRVLADQLADARARSGLRCALRLTPNDIRDFDLPPRLRSGAHWEAMLRLFGMAGASGADLLAIESTGGKELCDDALLYTDLKALVFGIGVLAARDMEFLWGHIVAACRHGGMVASGDSACAFGNTAMVLADQGFIPKLLAAVVRVACVPRTLVACTAGAIGPSKDCAYEGPYLKAIAGIPISMEGRAAACAHLSHVGNIAQAVCDAWSNESVQNVRLLSGPAPVVSLEQLAYDCRLLNQASKQPEDARRLRDWLVASDAALDPQAWVLQPAVVLRLAPEIASEPTPYLQTRRAVRATLDELARAHAEGQLRVPEREVCWFDRLRAQADSLPEDEHALAAEVLSGPLRNRVQPAEYNLA